MTFDKELILNALQTVPDPDLGQDLVTLGMVKEVRVTPEHVFAQIELTTPACPMKDKIKNDAENAIAKCAQSHGLSPKIEIELTANTRSLHERAENKNDPLSNVKHIIAVGAGKGGVGKSKIALSLAVGLSKAGAKCGILDADIYGPSLVNMLGLEKIPARAEGNTIIPFETCGIKAMTIGKLVDPDQAVIWRGPKATGAFRQMLLQTDWGNLDYLIIDLPPGTGDVPLTMAQTVPISGAVMVCTPQQVAQDDTRRAIRMFQQLNVEIIGLVENMSVYVDDEGREHDLFGKGGVEKMAAIMNLGFLGSIPIHPSMRVNADTGRPDADWDINDQISQSLDSLASSVAQRIAIATAQSGLVQPTISVQ